MRLRLRVGVGVGVGVGENPAIPFRPSPRGFALLVVLWCVGIMSLTVLGLVGFVNLQMDENVARAKDFRAAQLAESGLALGIHPSVKQLDPILKQQLSSLESFSVEIHSEGAKFNLNLMLQAGQTDILSRLWVQWGLTQIEATALNDCLLDWIDADDNRRLNGAERNEYTALGFPNLPSNQPFQTLDEVAQVIGFSKVVQLRPDWQNFFTLWSDGRLDLNEAPAELLAATFDISLDQSNRFVTARAQLTQPGSLTPYKFKSTSEPQAMLNLSSAQFSLVSNLITISSPISRIVSLGKVGSHVHTIVAITKRDGKNAGYYLWQEF